MTVCVAVKVHDCLVFAADSASTLTRTASDGSVEVLNVYMHADKVFNLHRKLPLVAMTCGDGHIGSQSIASLAKEMRHALSAGETSLTLEKYTVEEVVGRAQSFLEEKYAAANPTPAKHHSLEFWIGGYGSDNKHGEIWKIVLNEGTFMEPIQLNKEDDQQGVFWGGQAQAISRLLLGIDPAFIPVITKAGIDEGLTGAIYAAARQELETQSLHATMPVIDAIRFAEFLVSVTKGYHSFAYGSNIVGGATDVATVTKWEGFKWINRKHFYPSDLNRGETDHVC